MKNVFFLFCFIIFASCQAKREYVITNDGNIACDSTMLIRSGETIYLHLDSCINNYPLVSQIYDNTEKQYYIMLDDNKLYFFDLNSGCMEKSLEINECGKLNNYSGFLYHTPDTIFVYNYKNKAVYMLDSLCHIRRGWNIKAQNVKYPVDVEALNYSPILYNAGQLILSGSVFGQDEKLFENTPLSCIINIVNNEIKYVGRYPDNYKKGDFGGVYLNSVSHAVDADGNCIYSFPIEHKLYKYNKDFSSFQTIDMGSRYISKISSSTANSFELLKDKNLRIKYYISQDSYAGILHDKFNDLYYRIAEHPLNEWESGATFCKPFSIIVLDKKGKLISETSIVEDYKELNLHNAHVVKDGILIQKENDNENIIEFVKFEFNDGNN